MRSIELEELLTPAGVPGCEGGVELGWTVRRVEIRIGSHGLVRVVRRLRAIDGPVEACAVEVAADVEIEDCLDQGISALEHALGVWSIHDAFRLGITGSSSAPFSAIMIGLFMVEAQL